MNSDLAKQLAEAARKLGLEAVRVWPDAVAYVWTWTLVAVILEAVVFLTFAAAFFLSLCKWKKDDEWAEVWGMAAAAAALIAVIALLVLVVELPSNLATLRYPEAGAVFWLTGRK